MLAFRDKPVTAQQVGQQLGAAYVLEGSIRRAGNRVRITAQLVEASTRHSVWAERYDRQLEDVFAIQEEIARSIAQALRITLTPQEEKTIARKPTENPQAYDFYLRGRSYAHRENMDYGLQMFEQAIQLDPNFALAHAGIAQLCGLIYEIREQNPKWIERGLAACDRATALAPDLPEVLVARARISLTRRRNTTKPRCSPNVPSSASPTAKAPGTSSAARISPPAIPKKAAALIERAIEANGDDYNTYVPYFNALERLGRKKEAEQLRDRMIKVLRQQLELGAGRRARPHPAGRQPRLLEQDADESIRHLADRRRAAPRRSEHSLQRRLHLRQSSGKRRKRSRRSRRHLRPATATRIGPPKIPISIACTMIPEFQKLVGGSATSAS